MRKGTKVNPDQCEDTKKISLNINEIENIFSQYPLMSDRTFDLGIQFPTTDTSQQVIGLNNYSIILRFYMKKALFHFK